MQTVETLNEGLKRAYTLTIAAKDIIARVDAEVKTVAPTVRMPGFRPGKVPANLIKKMHGPALERQALDNAVRESVQSLLSEKQLRPAMQPAVELDETYEPGKDAEVKVTLEVLPEVPAPQIEGLALERLTVEVPEDKINEQLHMLASQQKSYDPAADGHAAATGDLVVMDFVGKVGDVAFEGGTGEGMSVEIGSGRLIPGFEDQLIGVKAGEERVLNVTFPADYNVDNLKGKDATFEVKVTELKTAKDAVVDEEFAKSLGLEGLEQLRGLMKGQVEQELNNLTRTHMKRKLLDQLAATHDFPVPPSMVEAEFEQIWRQLEHEATHEENPDYALAEMEKERDDYRAIAERRVRLGLLLSEIGQKNGIDVSQAEMNRLVSQAAQQYQPKDRERFVQYIQQEPMAAAQLRAPLYEDKVVDFLFEKAEISERSVTREELEAAIESEDGAPVHVHGPGCGHDHHDHDHDHAKPKAKKAAAKKAELAAEVKSATAKKAKASNAPAVDAATSESDAPTQPKKKAPPKKAKAEG
jgi:trigger factor